MNKVWLIFRKEWMEIRQQYLLLGGLVVVPLAFVIIIGVVMANPLSGGVHGLPALDLGSNPQLAKLNDAQMIQLVFGMQLRMVFMLMPLLVSSIIPAYSIVGEKNSRTLEPLLATPISSAQLLMGKCLNALVISTVLSWLGGIFFVIEMLVFTVPPVTGLIINPGWLIALFLVVPGMALVPIAISVYVSSRVNDPRSAQQFSSLIVLVLAAGVFLVLGVAVATPWLALLAAVGFGLLGAGSLYLATRLFRREVILTRWN
jgi:ABC-2 type transport system permease protein